MASLSQSAFLQALGWATLNSFWQMALLWWCYVGANYIFSFSASKKYLFSVAAVFAGAVWFIITFLFYYGGEVSYKIGFIAYSGETFNKSLNMVLTAASVTYLLLLTIPAYRLFQNWRRVQYIKNHGLHKVEIRYKLFVKKIAAQLGIKKTVGIHLSDLVKSPLTIGYLKPLILLPVASINNLTVQQVEAVLLHELSHIKRFDYLINIVISIIHTVLYFNPFARLLIKVAQEERENCCDQMVLQFGYDKLSYASALLSLEKSSSYSNTFAIAAAGKRNLLSRIEKIVGIEKKIVFRFNHLVALVAAFLCIFIFNSLLIISREKNGLSLSFNSLENPFYFFNENENLTGKTDTKTRPNLVVKPRITRAFQQLNEVDFNNQETGEIADSPPIPSALQAIPVAYRENEATVSEEQKKHVEATIENTKKFLGTYQWKEVEEVIGNDLTQTEKAAVKQEYLQQVNKIDWENLEKGLLQAYANINWKQIDANIRSALKQVQLDSLQVSCEATLKAIEKVQAQASPKVTTLPFPDESVKLVEVRKEEVKACLNEIKATRSKKIIKL